MCSVRASEGYCLTPAAHATLQQVQGYGVLGCTQFRRAAACIGIRVPSIWKLSPEHFICVDTQLWCGFCCASAAAGQRERMLAATERMQKTSDRLHVGKQQLAETEVRAQLIPVLILQPGAFPVQQACSSHDGLCAVYHCSPSLQEQGARATLTLGVVLSLGCELHAVCGWAQAFGVCLCCCCAGAGREHPAGLGAAARDHHACARHVARC